MTDCRACGTSLTPFMSFGAMPIANGFVAPNDLSRDTYRFELAPAVCSNCSLFQLMDQPDATLMFHDEYAFFSQTSARMADHFAAFAEAVDSDWLRQRPDPFVVELGSNDGIMLRHFAARDYRHLGVEPSANVAAVAEDNGVSSLVAFFDERTAARIRDQHGAADAILAANVMCHIGDIASVARGFAALLKPDGVVIFEDPYLGDVLRIGSYDQIYDEHVFLFSVTSVQALFQPFGLEVIDARPIPTHGGSMRYTLARSGQYPASPAVAEHLAAEQQAGFREQGTWAEFRRRCENNRDELVALLQRLKAEGAGIAGYGATSKSTTVLTYTGIGPELIDYISDTTPHKQGKLTPGSHIPVVNYEQFSAAPPDYAVLFAWNHAAEIRAKERDFVTAGGAFIEYFPHVRTG